MEKRIAKKLLLICLGSIFLSAFFVLNLIVLVESLSFALKIVFVSIGAICLPLGCSLIWNANINLQRYQFFLKSYNFSQIVFLFFVNISEIVIVATFAIAKNYWLFCCEIIPIFYGIALVCFFRYYNYDSKIILNNRNSIYVGVGVKEHYMFDGIDIFSKKSFEQIKLKKSITLFNPFNEELKFLCNNLRYIKGKDYKFYMAFYPLNNLFTLIYFIRKKDAKRMYVNLHAKEDYELNKQIYLAYCADIVEPKGEYVYAQDNHVRYRVSNFNQNGKSQSSVYFEQNLSVPNITQENKISIWLNQGEMFFNSRSEADEFVKYVLNEMEIIKNEEEK